MHGLNAVAEHPLHGVNRGRLNTNAAAAFSNPGAKFKHISTLTLDGANKYRATQLVLAVRNTPLGFDLRVVNGYIPAS